MSPTSRRRVEGSLEKDQWDPIRSSLGESKGATLISVDTLKNEEEDCSCSEGSDKTCISSKRLARLTGMLFTMPGSKDWETFHGSTIGKPTHNSCLPKRTTAGLHHMSACQGLVNMKHSCKILYIIEVVVCASHTDEHLTFCSHFALRRSISFMRTIRENFTLLLVMWFWQW